MLRQLGYSPDLKEVVRGMLESNQTRRMRLRQLWEISKINKNRYL
jgi:hypothetical protein